jgi:serine/threonine protein kinase/Flp pilus assembly protein TadD
VRPTLGRLEQGEQTVSVEPRTLQVLVCLARHAPNVVSKQRLIREVWGEAFVNDEVLSHAVWQLRKVFGDEARNPRYIQTIARRGYRLLAEVSRVPAAQPLAPGRRVGRYEILEPVGGGAMGEVYKARDLQLGRVVALKFLPADLCRDPDARRRFLREAQAVAQLDHPNVATIYEAGESESGQAFLALAFYEGETLKQKLERGPLLLSEAISIARQIARGLAAAHRRQIVHRDVKPANVVVLPDGMVKLLDFGLAKMTDATTLTQLGSSPGTPAYKSPEQSQGEEVDPRSDLWALGVVLYEMVTGRLPFGGEYEQAVIYAILNEPPKPLGDAGSFPPELAAVITRALAKDPAARYATAEEMEEDLGCIPLGGSFKPRRFSLWLKWGRFSLRVKWMTSLFIALILFSSFWGIWHVWESRWELEPGVAQLMEQGDRVEWRADTRSVFQNAEHIYRQALSKDPNNPLIQAQLAALLARMDAQFPEPGRREEIRRLVEQAIKKAPGYPMPWVAQAKLLLLEEKPADAEKAAREAIEQDPEFDRGYTVLGEALFAQGKVEEGIEEIDRGVDVGEGYLRGRLVLAAKLQEISRDDRAIVELQKVLQFDRDHPTANQYLAVIYSNQGRNLDAVPLFRKVFEETRDPRSANGLGIVYFNLGRMDEAIAAFHEAYKLDPIPTVARNLGESYEKIGKNEEAREWYKTAISGFDRRLAQGGPKADLLSSRSFCAARLGRYDEALDNLQEAMKLRPKQTGLLFRAAQISAAAGRREDVYTYTQRAVQEGFSREEFRRDLAFSAFQDDPRFREILESPVR